MRVGLAGFVLGCLVELTGCGGHSYKLGGGGVEPSEPAVGGTGGTAREGGDGGTGVGGAAGSGAGAGGSIFGTGGASSTGGFAGSGPTTGGAAGTGGSSGPPLTDQAVQIYSDFQGVTFVEADESHVYFNDWGGSVSRMDHAGGGLARLADGPSYHMVADATHLYFTTELDVRRVAKTGGTVEILAPLRSVSTGVAAALDMALDESYVYTSTYEDRTVIRAPKEGGAVEVMARTSKDVMGGVAVSRGALYWSDYQFDGGVHRTELASGTTTLFYPMGACRLRAVGADLWLTPLANENFIVRAPFAGGTATNYPFGLYTTLFSNDETHLYWMWDALMRRNLTTGVEETVAELQIYNAALVALTREWIFVSDSSQPGGLYRLPKPAP
jgi:hypothetical protein